MGEAQLLESGSLNMLGRCGEARCAAQESALQFRLAFEDSFALANCGFLR